MSAPAPHAFQRQQDIWDSANRIRELRASARTHGEPPLRLGVLFIPALFALGGAVLTVLP